jgi:hypothetical protein
MGDSPSIPDAGERTIPIDVEHTGVRLAVPVLTVSGFLAGYFVTSWLFRSAPEETPVGCMAVSVGIVVAVLSAVLADRYLKRVWPSGRTLTLSSEGLHLRDQRRKRNAETRIDWNQRINLVAWRFTVARGSARIPKGWIMLAMKLLQDDSQLIFYTFVPAKEVGTLPTYHVFTPLASRTAIEKGALSLREASEQRRLLKAEDERWQDGAEIDRRDFIALLEIFNQHARNWQA